MRLFKTREAAHAGSWYPKDTSVLSNIVDNYLKGDTKRPGKEIKAVIAPHSGLSYGGQTAGKGFNEIDFRDYNTLFILGPSHYYFLRDCALSNAEYYATPFGGLQVDQKINEKLMSENNGCFSTMTKAQDEEEHSIEMMLPFVAKKIFHCDASCKIVPILVGCDSTAEQRKYARILKDYFNDPKVLFIISTDFCHWGKRFRYTRYDKEKGEIYQNIEALDRQGMDLIAKRSLEGFSTYLDETSNTICGRNPLSVLLAGLDLIDESGNYKIEWLDYTQSSKVIQKDDSSVSYASGICYHI